MKITEWIRIGSILTAMVFSKALAAPDTHTSAPTDLNQTVALLEQFTKQIKNSEAGENSAGYRWRELEEFQTKLWKAMALDPAPFAYVPVAQVPKNLFAFELNQELINDWAEIKKSTNPKDFRAQFEFDQYSNAVEQIISYRKIRKFPAARAIAKRGVLDQHYSALVKKITQNSDPNIASGGQYLTASQISQLETYVNAAKEHLADQSKSADRKNVFSQGGRFVLLVLIAISGFALGIAAFRFNPEFFHQYLDGTSKNKPLNGGAEKLDYVSWLKDFEDALHRLKASQLIHEKRIEELVSNSEKIHAHALSLHSDARIKNEANLEHRMATLIKEIHQQIDQAQKLQAADRIQIQSMLEHCLMLCDAVENNAIMIDQGKLQEPRPVVETPPN